MRQHSVLAGKDPDIRYCHTRAGKPANAGGQLMCGIQLISQWPPDGYAGREIGCAQLYG
ncbi:hypothetical protein [Iodobacter ciconiae]|uniref:hypothetical protein n=1 Tax=Iodobacter ciconiae TaxID=2496266 RepID=UPI0013DEAB65|nr:hypothetical protein [Iodobacter ciconiae]